MGKRTQASHPALEHWTGLDWRRDQLRRGDPEASSEQQGRRTELLQREGEPRVRGRRRSCGRARALQSSRRGAAESQKGISGGRANAPSSEQCRRKSQGKVWGVPVLRLRLEQVLKLRWAPWESREPEGGGRRAAVGAATNAARASDGAGQRVLQASAESWNAGAGWPNLGQSNGESPAGVLAGAVHQAQRVARAALQPADRQRHSEAGTQAAEARR